MGKNKKKKKKRSNSIPMRNRAGKKIENGKKQWKGLFDFSIFEKRV
jgi:hypothetical protein